MFKLKPAAAQPAQVELLENRPLTPLRHERRLIQVEPVGDQRSWRTHSCGILDFRLPTVGIVKVALQFVIGGHVIKGDSVRFHGLGSPSLSPGRRTGGMGLFR
jgi:hypothetical protein